METTPTPYSCSDCGVLVTDHDIPAETVAKMRTGLQLVCLPCYDLNPDPEDEDEDEDDYEPDYDAIMEDRAERNLWAAERALERAIDRARGYD